METRKRIDRTECVDPMEGDRSCVQCGRYHGERGRTWLRCFANLNYERLGFSSGSKAFDALVAEEEAGHQQLRDETNELTQRMLAELRAIRRAELPWPLWDRLQQQLAQLETQLAPTTDPWGQLMQGVYQGRLASLHGLLVWDPDDYKDTPDAPGV